MTQENINDQITKALDQITEALVGGGKTRDALYQLIQLESARVDSVEDKLDILMGERGARIADEDTDEQLESRVKSFEESISCYLDEELDLIADATITPKALLDLGFTEEYQPPIDGMAGFIYYNFSKHGIDLLSNAVSNEEPLYVFFENQFEIHNLRKLGDFILSLNEL